MLRASSRLVTSTIIHALWTPSSQPKSEWVRKCEPVSSRILAARAQATFSDSCGTSIKNLAIGRILPRRSGQLIRAISACATFSWSANLLTDHPGHVDWLRSHCRRADSVPRRYGQTGLGVKPAGPSREDLTRYGSLT